MKTIKKISYLFVIIFVLFLFLSYYNLNIYASSASSMEYFGKLSSMSEDECMSFITQNNISIPSSLDNEESLKKLVKSSIEIIENDPNYEFVYNFNDTQKFVNDIKDLVNNYYGIEEVNESVSSKSVRASYYLKDSRVYGDGEWKSFGGDWNPKWENYNCYAYSIKRSEYPAQYNSGDYIHYQPGDFSKTGSFYSTISIGNLATIVQNDLETLGMSNIEILDYIPTDLSENEKLICVRKCSADYHFMRYDSSSSSWYHKPSWTAVLKYNYIPSNDRDWTNENSQYGKEYAGGITYNSDIKYIVYSMPTINLSCKSISTSDVRTIESGNDVIYEVNINCAKSYKFTSLASSPINMVFYNNDMDVISSITPVMSNNNCTAIITAYLNPGTYYLRLNFIDSNYSGNITTKYQATYPIYDTYQVNVGETTLPSHLHIGDNNKYNLQTYFINTSGSGFYKFTIEATKSDGSIITYPLETLKIYDHMNECQEDKYNVKGYSQDAETLNGENYLYMYLERNGYFYIHISLLDGEFSSLKFIVERVSVDEIDVASRYDEEFTETLISSNNMTEYATGFSIDQTSMFELSATTSDTYSGNITLVLFRKEYNSNTHTYYKTDILGDYLSITSEELILEEGTYYIGFFGNTSKVPITVTIDRIVNTSEITDQVLVMDPSYALPYGTEVRHNGGVLGETTITEGFTRHVHFQNVTGVPSVERQDYNFYSSNTSYATVSEFGTVFAKAVSQNREVTITAVYKYNPAIIFTIDLVIVNDTSNTPKVIETTQTIYLSDFVDGKYKLVLDEQNSPYPWIQYFNWSIYVPCQKDDILVTMDNYGFLTTSGAGSATLTGEYTINPNVTVIININFVE